MQLLPKKRSSYYRYDGSLTTPSCDEAVIWTVLKESIPFAITQIERFQEVKDDKGEQLTHNYRQLQRLNSRPLVYVKDEHEYNSSASYISVSLMAITVATVVEMIRHFC